MQQPIDNKYERFESLPEPVQRRLFELMAAMTGALGLPELHEEVKAPEQEARAAEVKSLGEARIEHEQKTDAELRQAEARAMLERLAA